MLDTEKRVLGTLTEPKQRRFTWLLQNRNQIAHLIAEMMCWTGNVDMPSLDRQLVLLEQAMTSLVGQPDLAVALAADWIVADAALIHVRGVAPFDCAVCRTGGIYGVEDILARLPEQID